MNLTQEFRQKVRQAVIDYRPNFGGSDAHYAKKIDISASVYSRLKKGETERILSDSEWLRLGREFEVTLKTNTWKTARTAVYTEIEDNLKFCQQYSKSMIMVDDCGIGKTYCTRHIIKTLRNAFYIDCSQAKTRQQFMRLLAKTIGVDNKGRYIDVKNNLKYYLNLLETPLIVLDEAGDLDYYAFLELKEMWNATDGKCGWYMLGADGLRNKIERGIRGKKVGYAEIFSRFSDEFIRLVPVGTQDKQAFYRQLITEVAQANLPGKTNINPYVNKCLAKEGTLRYLETLINVAA